MSLRRACGCTPSSRCEATEKPGVLFLCAANSARSVMAEEFFRLAAGDRFDVTSAGLDPMPIHPFTVAVMRELGIDLEGRRPHGVRDYLGRKFFRYVVMVCKAGEAGCPKVWPFAPVQLAWPFDDLAIPKGTNDEQLARFRAVRDQFRARVSAWVAELREAESSR